MRSDVPGGTMRAFYALLFLVMCAAPVAAQQAADARVEVRVAEVLRLDGERGATRPTATADDQADGVVLHITANVEWRLEAAAAGVAPVRVRVRGSDVEIPVSSEWTSLASGEAGRRAVVVEPVATTGEVSYRLVGVSRQE